MLNYSVLQRGPREPPVLEVGMRTKTTTTVFVDFLPQGMAREWLFDLFAEYGKVVDVYISRKIKTTNKEAFGFVRYSKKGDAKTAIEKINGHMVKGKKIKVSFAKYKKGGRLFTKKKTLTGTQYHRQRTIKFSSFRVTIGDTPTLYKENRV